MMLTRGAFAFGLALVLAAAATPLGAQGAPPGLTVEGWVGQSRLEPALLGDELRLSGTGVRLLVPVAALGAGDDGRSLARRLAVGGFLTTASTGDGVDARHVGVQADLRLTDRWLRRRVEPLLSLGVGAFHARREGTHAPFPTVACLDGGPGSVCRLLGDGARAQRRRELALSPALGLRYALRPGLALRADVRDVIVYDGAPRHNAELAVGVSLR